MEMITSKSIGSGNWVSTLGDRKRLSDTTWCMRRSYPRSTNRSPTKPGSADVVMLDHQGTHGPSLIWIRTIPSTG